MVAKVNGRHPNLLKDLGVTALITGVAWAVLAVITSVQ